MAISRHVTRKSLTQTLERSLDIRNGHLHLLLLGKSSKNLGVSDNSDPDSDKKTNTVGSRHPTRRGSKTAFDAGWFR